MISVIIPMHNAERYIGRCLDSLAAQTFRDLEVWIVDDGSTDGSENACLAHPLLSSGMATVLAGKVRFGVGAARNKGMKFATGDLLFFLDADDYLLPCALQVLHDAYVSSGSSIVVGGAFRQSADGRVLKSNAPALSMEMGDTMHCGKQAIAALVMDYIQTNDVYAVSHCWGRLYERRLIVDHDIRFDESMRLGEDGVFNTRCLLHAESVTVINKPLYGFQMHGGSLSREPINAKQLVHDFRRIKDGLVRFFALNYMIPEQDINAHIANLIISHLIYTSRSGGNEDELRWQIDELLESKFVQDMLECYVPKDGQDLEIPMLMKGGMPSALLDRCRKRAGDSGGGERVVALTEKDVLLHRIKESGRLVVIRGYDVVGWKLLDMLNDAGIFVWAFTDRDEAKHGFGYGGYPIVPMSEVPKDALCVIAAMSIADVVDDLEQHGLYNWLAADVLLSDYDCTQDSPDFQIDETRWQVESVRISHAAYRKPDYVFIRSLDVMITERCSMKCKDCSNLMQYFEKPRDFDVAEVILDVDDALENVDEVLEARVLGGDAFMHKDWGWMVRWLCEQEKVRRVVVYTNGRIVPDHRAMQSLCHGKVTVSVTDYGQASTKINTLIEMMRKRGVWHKVFVPDVWIDCATISKHNRSQDENDDLFRHCVATNLLTLADGKLFRCPYAASAWLLGVTEDEWFVDVRDEDVDRKNIRAYVNNRDWAMHACDFCTGRILTNTIETAVQTKHALAYERRRA